MTGHDQSGCDVTEGELLRLLVENVRDCAIFVADPEGRVRSWNPGAERLLGYPESEIVGQLIARFFTPADVAASVPDTLMQQARETDRCEGERWLVRKDGSRFWSVVMLNPLWGAARTLRGFAITLRDVGERTRAESRRAARLAITQVLAQAATVSEATIGVLRAVCESLEWDVGFFWTPDRPAGVLRCLEGWHRPDTPAPTFEMVSRGRAFNRDEGLPGRVWASGKPAWVLDVTRDANFPRAAVATQDGLHGAFACPLIADGEIRGVIEFFSRRVREPDADLLEMMTTIASQIGLFVVRRQAEDALRESERRFARFMQHLPGLAWIKDPQGRYVYANDAAEVAFGTPRDRLYGKTDEELFPPATAAQFRENDRRAIEGMGVQTFEELQHPDGTTHYSLVSKFPIPTADSPASVGGIAIDVTDLRRAEDARQFLAEAGTALASTLDYEATLSAVARLAVPRLADWCSVYLVDAGSGLRRIAVAHTDPAKVQRAEEVARRYPPGPNDAHGVGGVIRSGEAVMASEVTDELLVAGARDPDHLALLRELGPRSVMIVPLVSRNRTLGAVTLVAAESGRRYGPEDLATAQELARRAALAVDNARLFRESEESLRRLRLLVEASARLTSSLELPAMQAAIIDLSHRLVEADAYAMWRIDAAAGAWVIVNSANLSEVYLRDWGRIALSGSLVPDQPIVAEDAQGEASLESRRQMYRSEGIESVIAVPLRIHGVVTGTLVFYYKTRRKFDDVTIRVACALADLAGAALGTAELYQRERESRCRAEDADRAKDEFLALLGHELRNPLAPIKNALHILELKGDDVEVSARARARIDRQVTHLTRLVDELLDASRIARGKVRLSVEPLDFTAIVRTTVEDHRDGVEAAGLVLEIAAAGPIRVQGDSARLTQVVSNLLTNAIKFTLSGGRIIVRIAIEGSEAVVSVSDTGIGIAAADLPNLFQAFRQVDADPARTKGGLGLGLAVVKGLVELHGGQVTAESAGRDAGATFTVRLPVIAPDRDAEPNLRLPDAIPAASGRRVVIVEDREDTAESLRELLELNGFTVSVAATGPDGVALCRRERPDAVVCDIGLPGMTGFEVAQILRADPATADATLVAVSGYAQEEDRRKARESGFDALLAKPADTTELTRLLNRPQR